MPATEMVVMVSAFAALALTAIYVLRLLTAAIFHRTVRRAIDRDPAMAESLLGRLSAPSVRGGDDRTAVLLIATGIAIVVACLIIGEPDLVHYGIAGAMFPLIIGAALWARDYFIKRGNDAGTR
jgi:hypothetical protein